MNGLIQFMNSVWGRAARVILGLALIWYGLFVLGGTAGVIVAVIGLIPIGLGLAGRCVLEPFASPNVSSTTTSPTVSFTDEGKTAQRA